MGSQPFPVCCGDSCMVLFVLIAVTKTVFIFLFLMLVCAVCFCTFDIFSGGFFLCYKYIH